MDAGYVGGEEVIADTLNDGQRLVFEHIVEGFRRRISGAAQQALSNTIIMGTAGVGKSFLIRALETAIWHIARDRFGNEAYPNVRTAIKLVAFTGKAAFQVGGTTIHSLLSIRNVSKHEPLSPEPLRELQRNLKNTHFLFIDEMSMVGLKMLYVIDQRLREAFPMNREQPFGGVRIVMFGDFAQLPPVMDAPLFHRPNERSPEMHHHAARLYRDTFNTVFQLTQQMRQQGRSDIDFKFAALLAHLRTGEVTEEDWRFMQSRVLAQLPADEVRLITEDALALFPTNEQVREKNLKMLESLQRPVARIEARYVDIDETRGRVVKEEFCGGMQQILFLSVGARVCRNIEGY